MSPEKKNQVVELKASDSGSFEGYASKFGEQDQGGDVIERGAFSSSLLERPAPQVKMLWQHEPSEPIGRWTEIKEDTQGLHVKGQLLLDLPKAQECLSMMKAGILDGLSIGYQTVKAATSTQGVRLLKEVRLWEISLVVFPMLESAKITGVKDWTPRLTEQTLRDAGMPNALAKRVVAGGWKAAAPEEQRDADLGNSLKRLNRLTHLMKGTN